MIEFYDLMPDKPEMELIKKIDITLTTLGLEKMRPNKRYYYIYKQPEAIDISNRFNSNRIKVIKRPEELASSATSAEDLIK